jgi:hypothetical protein
MRRFAISVVLLGGLFAFELTPPGQPSWFRGPPRGRFERVSDPPPMATRFPKAELRSGRFRRSIEADATAEAMLVPVASARCVSRAVEAWLIGWGGSSGAQPGAHRQPLLGQWNLQWREWAPSWQALIALDALIVWLWTRASDPP